jgi:Ca2+/Na+ antiporter
VLLLLLPNRRGRIERSRGALMLALYAGFIWATLKF